MDGVRLGLGLGIAWIVVIPVLAVVLFTVLASIR
jgi:hypothetical protein